MPEHEPKPLAEEVDAVITGLLAKCPDPRAADIKRQFAEAVAEAGERFDRWRRDALADRTPYHATCGLPGPEAERAALQDVSEMTPAVVAEREHLVAEHWRLFLLRLQAVFDAAAPE